jgi:UDP:flavonoid glycosyltransferase YjiC (YdhE family)
MVFSNVGYLPLAGAQRAGIANAALCSLNWFDIYRHYTRDAETSAQIRACYAGADAFLRTTPGMAMETLPNLIPVAPIAAVGKDRRDELDRHLRLSKEERLVLVSMGGIASRLPLEGWPRIDGVRWLVQQSWHVNHPDVIELEALPMDFGDLLASSDVLLCKPGYGSFVEAACSGTPVLYVDRPDWPESPALLAWLQQYGVCREVSRQQLEHGSLRQSLLDLLQAPLPIPPHPAGAAQAADWLMQKLSPSG